ncbi:hypothetical protein P5673_014471 [Acropora cervicornis]|uniref:Uncharacterized protein n=1 Tax=Acropora cervicornis TaxID=6130 RepID=A0AAD9QK03_ACRCE|nr:hypothetical protein P5673_014471 [Acropora cervicornis]
MAVSQSPFAPELNEKEIMKLLEDATPDGTKKATKYGMKIFHDWLLTPRNKFSVTAIEEINKEKLNACLKSFYTSVRKQDSQFYKSSLLKAMRAATDRPSQHSKLRSSSKVVNLVRRTPKIQHSFKEQRGRENQPEMKPAMLALRATPQGEEYFEVNREFPGSLPATKNHQDLCMRMDLPLDKKLWKIRTGPPGHRAAGLLLAKPIDILYLQMQKKNNFLLVLCNLEDLQVHLLHELGHHFSVTGVLETKITKTSLLDFNPSIASYEFEDIPTPLAAVGVKIYIKSDLNYALIEKSSEDAFQASRRIAVRLYYTIKVCESAN